MLVRVRGAQCNVTVQSLMGPIKTIWYRNLAICVNICAMTGSFYNQINLTSLSRTHPALNPHISVGWRGAIRANL